MTFTATRRSLQPPPSAQPVQRKFPRRARLSIPSTKSELKQRRIRRKNQSTLTQLPYFSSFESRDEDGSELSDPDFEEPQPKKKRKTMSGARNKTKQEEEEELKQATLTQIGWPCPFEDSDEDEEAAESGSVNDSEASAGVGSEGDGHEHADVPQSADGFEDVEDNEQGDQTEEGGVQQERTMPSLEERQPKISADQGSAVGRDTRTAPRSLSPVQQSHTPSSRPNLSLTPQKQWISPSPELAPPAGASNPKHAIPISPFKTPQKSARSEIPSSQSPTATPLTRDTAAAASTPKSTPHRTPLSELHRNVWAQRDESPTPKPKGKRKSVPDSDDTDELDKENMMDDLDNYDGYHSDNKVSKIMSQGSRRTQHQQSPYRPPQSTSSHGSSNGLFAHPPLPTTGRTPRSQWRSTSSSKTATDSMQASPSTSSFKARLARLSPPKHIEEQDTLRSSQATTVDVTQRSPVPSTAPSPAATKQKGTDLPPGYNPNLPPLPSSPRAFESQFPYSMFSVYEDEDEDEDESQTYGLEAYGLESDVEWEDADGDVDV